MPYLPQDFRPVPGAQPPAPTTLAPTETELPPPVKTEQPQSTSPRYRTFRDKDKDKMLPRLSILNYAPNQHEVVDHMLHGGRRK